MTATRARIGAGFKVRSALFGSEHAALMGLLLLAAALFPRPLTAAGAPRLLNFIHFAAAGLFLAVALPLIRNRVAQRLLFGIGVLFFSICTSALLNGAGVVNAVLDFLLLSEPFILLILFVAAPLSGPQLLRFRLVVIVFACVHLGLALYQIFVQGQIHDAVKGVFTGQGAGHHVAGAVAMTTGCYVVLSDVLRWKFIRFGIAFACALVAVKSDSKQVVAVFLAAVIVLALLRVRDARRAVLYASVGPVAILLLWLARDSFPLLPLIMDDDRLRRGLEQKLSIFPLLLSHCESGLNWLLGLGPGHTVGRLASLLPDYAAYLQPLGATTSNVTAQAVVIDQLYVAAGTSSSAWSPMFFWAGLVGDLGLAGLLSYLALWFVVWQRLCASELSRFLLLTVMLFGAVFSWLEEPGYMLYVTAIIGIDWHSCHQRHVTESTARRASA